MLETGGIFCRVCHMSNDGESDFCSHCQDRLIGSRPFTVRGVDSWLKGQVDEHEVLRIPLPFEDRKLLRRWASFLSVNPIVEADTDEAAVLASRTHESRAGRRSRTRYRASAKSTLLWLAVRFGFRLVPGIVSQVVRPGWGSSAVTQYANAGAAIWAGLLALSGLGVAAIGLRFGLTGRATQGRAAAVHMYGGVVVGTWLSVIIVDSGGYDVGAAAAMLAFMIGIPYWVCAGSGLVLGSEVFKFRTR